MLCMAWNSNGAYTHYTAHRQWNNNNNNNNNNKATQQIHFNTLKLLYKIGGKDEADLLSNYILWDARAMKTKTHTHVCMWIRSRWVRKMDKKLDAIYTGKVEIETPQQQQQNINNTYIKVLCRMEMAWQLAAGPSSIVPQWVRAKRKSWKKKP